MIHRQKPQRSTPGSAPPAPETDPGPVTTGRPVHVAAAYTDMVGSVRYTSMSRRALDYARSRGELPYLAKGRKIVVKLTDLDAWMERDRIDVTADVARIEATKGRTAAGNARLTNPVSKSTSENTTTKES